MPRTYRRERYAVVNNVVSRNSYACGSSDPLDDYSPQPPSRSYESFGMPAVVLSGSIIPLLEKLGRR